mgnify:CR=1 FL=1
MSPTSSTTLGVAPLGPAAEAYRRAARRRAWLGGLVCLGLLASVTADVLIGPAALSVPAVLAAILRPDTADPAALTIVWTFRLPTALMAVLIGSALGVAGTLAQTILNNPLASPYTLGVSAAAGFGAALAMVCGAGLLPFAGVLLVPLSAFFFATLSVAAIYAMARRQRGTSESLVLGGVALLFLFNAGVALLQYLASEDQLQAIVFWLFGSLEGATWRKLAVLAATLLVVLPWLGAKSWQLTALRLGDGRAQALGVEVKALRLTMLLVLSVLTATSVCFAGSIGFIGLVAPHLGRMAVGEEHRFLLPVTAALGALLLSGASVASKLVVPEAAFPIGIATAFLGVPFFASMVLARKGNHW